MVADRIPRGIRTRTTAVAVVVAAISLLVAAVGLTWLLENNLRDNLDAAVETQARARADLLDTGADPATLVDSRDGESLVWIGTADTTLAVGGNYRVVGPPPDLAVGGARGSEILVDEPGETGGSSEQELADVRWAVASAADGTLVGVGFETESIGQTVGEVRNLLAVGLPMLLVVLGLVTWRATGRTLRPVEQIRATAEGIGADTLHDRVPVPGTRDEVQRLAETMNGMLDRLEAQQAAQRRFTADASHELKSPVANLRATIETSAIDDPRWEQVRPMLVAETDRLATIVDDLLFMAVNDESGLQPVEVATVHLDDVLFDEAQLLSGRSGLTVDIGGVRPCDVQGHGPLLARAIRNLVSNAERHAASTVSFACSVDGVMARVIITDDGPGVPADKRDLIFERFGRVSSSRERASGGTGLGLAIVRGVAERHGGGVDVDDAPGGGARFTLHIPTSR